MSEYRRVITFDLSRFDGFLKEVVELVGEYPGKVVIRRDGESIRAEFGPRGEDGSELLARGKLTTRRRNGSIG